MTDNCAVEQHFNFNLFFAEKFTCNEKAHTADPGMELEGVVKVPYISLELVCP